MKVFGITGGVGAGKSEILSYIKKNYRCKILVSDQATHELMKKGQKAYQELVDLLSDNVLDENGEIEKQKMASMIFTSDSLREQVNQILHPAIREVILEDIQKERAGGQVDFYFLEAALLIECGYLSIVDEMWYIYADENIRRERLKKARGYSEEKITSIMQSQLSDAEFRKNCHVVIDNSGTMEDTIRQIDKKLGGYL